MKFENMKYERPNIQEIEKTFKEMIDEFKNSKSAKEQLEIINKLNDYSRDFSTMFSLANIRYSINTNDEFYKKEIEFINENEPILDGLENEFKKLVFNSKFKEELKEKLGEHYFNLIELKLKTFKPEIIEDLKEENKLKMQYTQLISSGKVEFQGKERTLSQLTPFEKSEDREVRKNASKAKYDWLASKVDQLDEIYDNLVKVRDRIAKKLGYENFVQLGYDRMRRTDYDHKMVKNYRDQVKEVLVPLTQKLYKEQKERVGIDDFKFYDEPYAFKGGNPDPVGTSDELVENARKMYEELSVETGEFFNFMIDNHLLGLESKEGKRPGGFCTSFPLSEQSRIFMTYSGSMSNVATLAHELGHAFHSYALRPMHTLNRNYAMNVAETASTFAEMIVADAAVKEAQTKEEKIAPVPESAAVEGYKPATVINKPSENNTTNHTGCGSLISITPCKKTLTAKTILAIPSPNKTSFR